MQQSEKIVPILSGHILRNRIDGRRVLIESQYQAAPEFVEFLRGSSDQASLRSHLSGYPVFGKACDTLYKVVGPHWWTEAGRSLVMSAMDEAVKSARSYQHEFRASFAQVQSLLVNELCEKLAQIADFDAMGLATDGSVSTWDVSKESFETWARHMREQRYVIAYKEKESAPNKAGLRVRLMCLALDDKSLGIALNWHF